MAFCRFSTVSSTTISGSTAATAEAAGAAKYDITIAAVTVDDAGVITALSISGQATGRFCFEGFLSTARKSRREHLEALLNEQRTMIFYEAPHKLVSTLEDLAETFGNERKISLCRELTKLHEEVVRTTLGEAIAKYTENGPKGEFVLIVAGAEPEAEEVPTEEDASAYLSRLMANGMSKKDAVKQTAKDLKLPKNEVYDLALKISE